MDIENLKKMSIYELRGVARSLGVKSPTTFRKQDLIHNLAIWIIFLPIFEFNLKMKKE